MYCISKYCSLYNKTRSSQMIKGVILEALKIWTVMCSTNVNYVNSYMTVSWKLIPITSCSLIPLCVGCLDGRHLVQLNQHGTVCGGLCFCLRIWVCVCGHVWLFLQTHVTRSSCVCSCWWMWITECLFRGVYAWLREGGFAWTVVM